MSSTPTTPARPMGVMIIAVVPLPLGGRQQQVSIRSLVPLLAPPVPTSHAEKEP